MYCQTVPLRLLTLSPAIAYGRHAVPNEQVNKQQTDTLADKPTKQATHHDENSCNTEFGTLRIFY